MFPHTHCSHYMECKETPEPPPLDRHRSRFKEAEFNGTETATACFPLYLQSLSAPVSAPLPSPHLVHSISICTTCYKENSAKRPSTMTARETEMTEIAQLGFKEKVHNFNFVYHHFTFACPRAVSSREFSVML